MPDGSSTPIDALKPSESQTGTPSTPNSSKRSISYWKSQINQKVASNIMASMRFGTDATARTPRDMRHSAVKEIKLEQKIAINPLTELMNKEPYENDRSRILSVIDRDSSTPTAEGILMDIDDFGIFNKGFGNTTGDTVLKMVGQTINRTIRESDIAGRVGGEELEITAQQTISPTRPQPEESISLAEKVRAAIETAQTEKGHRVTVSVGMTKYIRGEGLDSYLERLQTAQIAAKKLGKNKVIEGIVIENGITVYRDPITNIDYIPEKGPDGKIARFVPINV